jgi:hypothetical protein
MKRLGIGAGLAHDRELLAEEKADYLQANGGGGVAIESAKIQSLDSSVGFSSAPPAAKLADANQHLGVSTVTRSWSR